MRNLPAPVLAAAAWLACAELGNGYYNLTTFGNARWFFESTHVTIAPAQAEAWYQRAYESSRNRELKAKAAFMAAKSELARRLSAAPGGPAGPKDPADHLPIPTDWFPVVKSLGDTAYHREILRECGHYRRWAAHH